ncbi:MAG: beta-propeller domain-containing protein [Deltaproteobacteria bacterium]|jgi:uncharacterized secreted protein with C-terminal beta-propeller domain|nr:beta-propeller domain-containing protein [Deltaproteobacteria bacterium]MBW2534565.1 beta-propeller domain-containing protein [Deltaproteobacteria bacterium]
MKTTSLLILPVVSLGLLASGCSEDRDYAWTPATLSRVSSCEELELRLKEDALFKMHASIDAAIAGIEARDSRGIALGAEEDVAAGDGTQAPSAPGDYGDTPDHSETNVQVEGVDEADIVKTDGNYIYTLHGRNFAVVTAWPTSALELSSITPIEGYPLEMFVTDDKVVIYTRVGGQPIFEGLGLPPRTDPYGYDYPVAGPDYDYGSGYPSLTKVTVLSKSGAAATVEREYYFEGEYLSARRVGSEVHTVVTSSTYRQLWSSWPSYYGGDDGDAIDALEELRSENIYRIATAELEEFLAYRFVKNGDSVEQMPCPCADYWVPTEGTTQHGVTQLEAFDLDDPSGELRGAHIVGAVQTIYANAESLYLAASHWQNPLWSEERPDTPVSVTATHLHKFDIATEPAAPRYVASGTVPGLVHNQFSLDERDGYLRVATTDRIVSGWDSESVNDLFVLDQMGPSLSIVGQVTNLAPGEQIYSARFVGERGYIVTFRQVDPLFVFDLSVPHAPQLLGELKIPGFSEYMHPIEDGRFLLTIGQDGNDWGATGSPALQIFDVTDATNPTLVHKHPLPEGWTEAEQNHKAITYYHDMLALPFTRYDYSSWSSTLELFAIDSVDGITPLGTVDNSQFFDGLDDTGYCGGYDVGVRRGVFIDDYLYSVSHGGIVVNAVSDMTDPVAQLELPALTEDYDCYY